jgi:hypothetical protein
MSAASARRPTAIPKLASPTASEMIGMFAKRNPKASRAQVEAVGKLVAEFGSTVAKLSPTARQRLVTRKAELGKLIAEISAETDMTPKTPTRAPNAAPEVSQGDGLGVVVSTTEGRARLTAYATPLKVEEWAGQLAGPIELEREHGVARSTLHAWHKQGAVIGLLGGVRKHAFPVEQFIDGRPVAGVAPVLGAIGDPRIAWLWLREPNPGLAGASPLAILKSGAVDRVVQVARSNFGQR